MAQTKEVTSFTITPDNKSFLINNAKNKSAFINKAIDLYRKYMLMKELREGFLNQDNNDLELAMSDFDDYKNLIDN